MKLFYYHDPSLRNFGDDLNPWLWEKLLPGQLDNDAKSLFVGIGTILNDRLPEAKKVAVFGSGVGYGQGLPAINSDWQFYCVRGPLTAQRLGLSDSAVVTDAAILLRCVWTPPTKKKYSRAYMPHVIEAHKGGETWKRICEDLDVTFLDPRWPIEKVLEAVGQTEVLYTEAMHGAIVADALRVPWVPVRTSENILPFKWEDWCQSMEMTYGPQDVKPPLFRMGLYDAAKDAPVHRSLIYRAKATLTARSFAKIIDQARPQLSTDAIIQSRTEALEARLEQFRLDLAAGKFDVSEPLPKGQSATIAG